MRDRTLLLPGAPRLRNIALTRQPAGAPHASATLAVIATWWLMQQQIRVGGTTLTRVLRRVSETSARV